MWLSLLFFSLPFFPPSLSFSPSPSLSVSLNPRKDGGEIRDNGRGVLRWLLSRPDSDIRVFREFDVGGGYGGDHGECGADRICDCGDE